ncbi:MAG: condensation domain-containing protein, partial [Rhodococcus sp. (in: high G+C Gram-positive bacteria)]|uniref:condensation domain-containing protein n=1 Tax=Rhodococcus sp. TaxID=1831 RepID=UPI003D9BB10C
MSLRQRRLQLPLDAFPLSSAQRSIWFAQQLAPEVPICIAQYVDLPGELDIDRVRQAGYVAGGEFQSAYLRVVEVDGEPYQYVDPTLAAKPIDLVDFRADPDPLDAAHRWMTADYSRPVDLAHDPLVNMTLLRVGDARYLWYGRIHHVALDGYAAMTMVNRIAALYTAAVEGRDPEPSRAADLRTLYDWDRDYRASSRYASDRDYWMERVAGLEDGSSLATRTGPLAPVSLLSSIPLPGDLVAALTAVDEDAGSSSTAAVVAAFGCYLARMSGTDDVVVNLPVSARTTASARRSGGMLVNTAPLHLHIDPDDTRTALVRRVQLELTGALRHQRCSIEDIRRESGTTAPHAYAGPTINVMLFRQEILLGDLRGEFHIMTSGPVEDLLVNIYQSGTPATTFIDFRGNPHRYDDPELRAHHRRFVGLLTAFLQADGDAPVAGIDPETAAIGVQRARAAEAATYWQAVLADAPDHLALPRPAAAGPDSAAAETGLAEFDTDLPVAPGTAQLLRDHAADPESVLVAATSVVTSVLTGSRDTLVGAPADTAVLPLRSDVDPTVPFEQYLNRMRGLARDAATHADVDPAVLTGVAVPVAVGLTDSSAALPQRDTTALMLRLTAGGDGVHIHGRYRPDAVDEDTARGFVTRLARVLDTAVTTPATPLGDL